MTKTYSQQSEDGTEIEIFGVTRADVEALYPTIVGLWPPPPDNMLDDFPRLVYVFDEERPEIEFGDEIESGEFVKDGEGVWWRTWVVVTPDAERLAEIKEELAEEARRVAETKRAAMFQGARPYELSVRLQMYQEVANYDALPGTPTPNPLNFPLLAPLAQARGTTLPQEMAAIRAESHAWWTGAAQIEVGLEATVSAIMAATTAPEAKAVLDDFEAAD